MAITNRALAFASRWFDEATVRRTFEPLIADWQREWQDASGPRRRWVSLRGLSAFICAVAISSPTIIATPIPRSISWRVAKRIAVFCLVVAGALSIVMLRSRDPIEQDAPLWAAMLLMALPAALTMAFPFAMVIAVDAIRRDAALPHVERAAALKLGVIAVCFMLTVGGFVAPLASREWRALSTPAGWNTPQPRLHQLSTLELLTHPERDTAIVPRQYTRAGEIRRELINRSVLSLLPALFVWLRWTALGQRRRRRFWPLPTALMTAVVVVAFFMTFYSGFILEREWALQPGTGLFLPPIVFALWSLAEQRLARRPWRGGSAAPHEA